MPLFFHPNVLQPGISILQTPECLHGSNCQAQGRDPSRAPSSHGAPRPQLQEAQHYHPNPTILPGARGCASLTNLPKGRHPSIVCGFNERATTGSTTDVKNPRDVCTSGWQRGWPLGKGAALGDGLGGREDPRRSVGRARGRRLRSRHPPRGEGARASLANERARLGRRGGE